jgi:hypothetical protein
VASGLSRSSFLSRAWSAGLILAAEPWPRGLGAIEPSVRRCRSTLWTNQRPTSNRSAISWIESILWSQAEQIRWRRSRE